MNLLNQGINAYGPLSIATRELNAVHPCYVDPCPWNICGPCSYPFAVAMC